MHIPPVTYAFDLDIQDECMRRFILHELASCGIRHLVVSSLTFREILRDFRYMDKLLIELEAEGMSFVDSHAIFGGTNDLLHHGDMYKHYSLLRKLQINLAAGMGVDTITFHPGNDSADLEYSIDQLMDNVKRNLDEILPEAEKCGVTVCIENSWNIMSSPEGLLEIKKDFPTDTLGFCFDSGHANLLSPNAAPFDDSNARQRWALRGKEVQWEDRALEKMLPHVVNCHLHDNNAVIDQHLPPGAGSVDWKKTSALLKKAPRLKCIQCEVAMMQCGMDAASLSNIFNSMFAQEQ